MKLTVVESPTTSRSILLKKQELQQDIFETKQNWYRKVKNREYSKAKFWVYCRELHANAKFKMADYSKKSLDQVRTNTHAQPWHCSFKLEKGPTDKAKEPDPGGSDQQNLGFKKLKNRKTDRTVGLNFCITNISSGTAWLLQGFRHSL